MGHHNNKKVDFTSSQGPNLNMDGNNYNLQNICTNEKCKRKLQRKLILQQEIESWLQLVPNSFSLKFSLTS